ncbi:hypothetical protein GQX73_g10830 [Xylaria multiplex]|uniref:Uncharacterized protein n=1 Tax=Xylaria multiplex TaxID=323545 RepID=A0A7C8IG35_9PEZI|nr:hypothetical protein GQX73_g10830 [Xylaria multiplex]
MDHQDNNEQEPERNKVGRPPKPRSHGQVGRPRKHDGPYHQPPRGLRAPKRKFVQPPSSVGTRLKTGNLEPKDYRLRKGADPPVRRGRGRPRAIRRRVRRSRPIVESDEDDSSEAEGSDAESSDAESQHDGRNEDVSDDDISMGGLLDSSGSDLEDVMSQQQPESLDLGLTHKGKRKQSVSEISEISDSQGSLPPPKRQEILVHRLRPARPPPPRPVEEADQPRVGLEQGFSLTGTRVTDFLLSPSVYLDVQDIRGAYWSSDIEADFNRLWVKDDHNSRFDQGLRARSDEIALWKVMLVKFSRSPPHLFTYGLKLEDDCYEAPGSLMLSSEASYTLQRICVHPIWAEDLDLLRYVLQMAVKASMGTHSEPIGPPPVTSRYYDKGPGRSPIIARLISEFEERIQFDTNAKETGLFILTIRVMKDLVRVLDQFGRESFSSTEQYIETFERFFDRILDEIEPQSYEQLRDLKWSLELSELRDIEIRKVMRARGNNDFLHDIPETAEYFSSVAPLYHHHPSMDRRALSVLRGEVTDPKRDTLQKLDRANYDRAEALDDFTAKLVEEVIGKGRVRQRR